jgi:hypothetical protein
MPEGQNTHLWNHSIQKSWGTYFGSFTSFLSTACELEFILEFNSYVGVGLADERAKKWFEEQRPNATFTYGPDLWRYNLSAIVPIAERFYESLRSDLEFVRQTSVDPRAIESFFTGRNTDERLLIFGGFLTNLRRWQSEVLMQQNRFPFFFEWTGRLDEIVKRFQASVPKSSQNRAS